MAVVSWSSQIYYEVLSGAGKAFIDKGQIVRR